MKFVSFFSEQCVGWMSDSEIRHFPSMNASVYYLVEGASLFHPTVLKLNLRRNYLYSRKQLHEIKLLLEVHYNVEEQSHGNYFVLPEEIVEHPERFSLKAGSA